MANYFISEYVVEGNKQDIDSFYEMMMRLKNANRQLEPGHFGNTWLGFILEEFGEDPEEYMCQGQWYDLTRDGDVLRFKAETAWEPCHQIRWMIEDKYPSLKFYYIGENDADEIFQKKDNEGKYFPENYYLSLFGGDFMPEIDVMKRFVTREDAYKYISELTDRSITNDKEFETLQNEWDEGGGGVCSLAEYNCIVG